MSINPPYLCIFTSSFKSLCVGCELLGSSMGLVLKGHRFAVFKSVADRFVTPLPP